MIIALAGRRVDAVDATQPRFPGTPGNLELVRARIRRLLQAQGATVLISSAACGADLLALSEAGNLGLRRRVHLPFDRETFRATSVTDRPGDWGSLYDKVLEEIEKNGDLLFVQPTSRDAAYAETNHAIVDDARSLGLWLQQPITAILVWEGKSRGDGDLTEEFGVYARRRDLPVTNLLTY